MSILIKGMEMPSRCWDCDLCYDQFYCKSLNICLFGGQDEDLRPIDFHPAGDRLPNCPIIEIPPHGRLIDADALMKLEVVPSDNWVFRAIEKAPTIIPAEEGET